MVRLRGAGFRSGSTAEMWSWMNGFAQGRGLVDQMDGALRRPGWWSTGGVEEANARYAAASADVAAYRALLEDPALVDQLRVQVLAAMEAEGLLFKDLAERIGKSAQSVRDALSFGNANPRIGTTRLFEEMIRGCGRVFTVGSRRIGEDTAGGGGRADEPAGIRRMRALLTAVDRRLIDGVSPSSPNRARKASEFTVRIAGSEVVRPKETLLHWLRGVADGAGDGVAQSQLAALQEESRTVLPTS